MDLKTKNLANHKISKVLVSDDIRFGDLAGARTQDPLLKREMLYQLSYQVIISILSFHLSGCKYKSNNLFHKWILREILISF